MDTLVLLGQFLRDLGWMFLGLGALLAGLGVLSYLSPDDKKKA